MASTLATRADNGPQSMSEKHVLVVFGTRPEAIKMIPLMKVLRQRPQLRVTVAVTGQHREMIGQVFAAFGESPDIDLDLMQHRQSLPDVTANVMARMTEVIARVSPDIVLVHGDTTTAMATAMAAFYAHCPVGHVEAGLRSHDLTKPWPEEFNRVTIDSLADYMFAPSVSARANLLAEYNRRGKIYVTGNTGIDALLQMSDRVTRDCDLQARLSQKYGLLDRGKHLILVTGHRRESFGDGFRRICEGLASVAARPDTQIVYPVHLNPEVKAIVNARLSGFRNIHLCEPVDYIDMVYLMQRAKILLTDSGGIQEEGPALGKPVLVMRDVTERPEAVATGVVTLIGTDPAAMRAQVDLLLDDHDRYRARARQVFPYGDGTAAPQIADILCRELP